MTRMFGDIEGVIIYFDDMGICAENEKEHDRIMDKVMERAQINNIIFNPNKIQYRKREVKFMGHILSEGKIKPVLAIYNLKLPVVVQTDASKDGLGCVIVQNEHPVANASRTLSKSEQKWAQIEKELLAIVFACQRIHYFLYGREFTDESDHKPLETLVKRDINDVAMRLQRVFMSLLRYPKMTVFYKPGKEMLVADCLSRSQLSECDEDTDLSGIIHSVTQSACLPRQNYDLYCSIKPNMNGQIKEMVKSCAICKKFTRNNQN